MGKIELRECPFCGGKAVLEKMGFPHHVYCKECGARITGIGTERAGELSAIEKWNTRKPMERIDEKLCDMIEPNIDMDTGAHCNNWVIDLQNEIVGKCIKIVRGGGAE